MNREAEVSMANLKKIMRNAFYALPINEATKQSINQKWAEYKLGKEETQDKKGSIKISGDSKQLDEYVKYIIGSYGRKRKEYRPYIEHSIESPKVHISAYYLTQFHPNPENDEWWGKGTTEWNNVNQAVPQFIGHYQPRKPGELGYYDLRMKENIQRQVELAHNYGISELCFYYYWFDGIRLLERPLDTFLKNKDLNIDFSYCWANENWTRKFSGTNADALMKITQTVESYTRFIDAVLGDMKDSRYHKIAGRPVLSIYRPSNVPDVKKVIANWNKRAKEVLGVELYLVAVLEANSKADWIAVGFDAVTEFQPRSVEHNCKEISADVCPIRKDFAGKIYDYEDLVINKRYENSRVPKCYPAVMPMWDNTARRNYRGTIFHGSNPQLYKQWLMDQVSKVLQNKTIDEKRIYINAWNEWGEGAYLEPDYEYGYAYLQATYEAVYSCNALWEIEPNE